MTKYNGEGKAQTNEALIQALQSIKRFDCLAFYHIIKVRVSNGVYYNYTAKKIAEYVNITEDKAEKLINQAVEAGLCEVQKTKSGNHLRCLSLDTVKATYKIRASHKCTIFILETTTLEEVKDQLLLKLIEQHQRREYYNNTEEKDAQISVMDSDKKESKAEKNSNGLLKNSKKVVGYRKLANTLGLSHSYIWNVVKRLKQRGFLRTKTVSEVIRPISLSEFKHAKKYIAMSFDGHIFYKHGKLMTCLGTEFVFKTYPIKQVKVSAKKLMKH